MDAPERVALVHDWLTGTRGGEKCLDVLCRRWPDATLHTLLRVPGTAPPAVERMRIRTSFLQRLPGVGRYYRYLLPAVPLAARWEIADCDLVVSLSHCAAKAAVPPPGVPHVCYCFTPMRYAWHMKDAYFRRGRLAGLKAAAADKVMAALRDWDARTAARVTHFVAISRTVRDRVAACYGRPSVVIYPPADTGYYTPDPAVRREDYYLVVSALAPYKRTDLAAEACRKLGRRLVVIGGGQDARRLRALAGPGVEFLGRQPDEVVRHHLRRCQALLFPGEEDYGIVPVEAMACGTPVIAYGRGGATETVVPPGGPAAPTGVWFEEQSPDALAEAVERFERTAGAFDPAAARRQAERFSKERYEAEIVAYLCGVAGGGAGVRRAA